MQILLAFSVCTFLAEYKAPSVEIKMRRIVVLPAQAVRWYGQRENDERKSNTIKNGKPAGLLP